MGMGMVRFRGRGRITTKYVDPEHALLGKITVTKKPLHTHTSGYS